MARPYAQVRDMLRGGELFTLGMFSLLGMFGHDFREQLPGDLLGLELLTLSSYALVALRRDNATATEAAMKYFVLGAMASGFLLYGLSMMYGATGSLDVNASIQGGGLGSGQAPGAGVWPGLCGRGTGVQTGCGAVPHVDSRRLSRRSDSVTLLVAGAPKLAAFAIVIRLLVEGFLPLAIDWQQMLACWRWLAVGG
jgi:NADH-quinone oxidoreductase subunit N